MYSLVKYFGNIYEASPLWSQPLTVVDETTSEEFNAGRPNLNNYFGRNGSIPFKNLKNIFFGFSIVMSKFNLQDK